MAGVVKWSERNVSTSLSVYLATQLLAASYLVYWHQRDTVQTPDGFYPDYAAQQDAYLAQSAFAARWAAAKGLVTLRGKLPANPAFVQRPNSSGVVGGQEEIPVPALAIQVDPAIAVRNVEMGNRELKFWNRHLLLFGFARTAEEQSLLADLLTIWFKEEKLLDLHDHDAGTGDLIDSALVMRPQVDADIEIEGPEATTYGIEVNARLDYDAD